MTLTETGPELTLALARSSDAGRYKCSLKVGEVTQTLVQTVHIRGGREEVSSTATMLEVNQGDEMTLSCLTSSEGKETPTVAWSKQVISQFPPTHLVFVQNFEDRKYHQKQDWLL